MTKEREKIDELRKGVHGKLIFTIFQKTSSGAMRGGADSEFDGDVILHTKVFNDYKQNFIYSDKNSIGKKVYLPTINKVGVVTNASYNKDKKTIVLKNTIMKLFKLFLVIMFLKFLKKIL